MEQDKLIAMAENCGAHHSVITDAVCFNQDELQAFANLIRRDQIERDADISESAASDANKYDIAESIRNQEVE